MEALVKWINDHELINRSELCRKAGVDRANLNKYLSLGSIPVAFASKLVSVLVDYGFNEANTGDLSHGNLQRVELPQKEKKTPQIKPLVAKTTIVPVVGTKPERLKGETALEYRIRTS